MLEVETFIVGQFNTNAYLCYNPEFPFALLIDPGGCYEAIKEIAEKRKKVIRAVLLTHGHFDHTLDVARFQKDGAVVYAHDKEQDVAYSSACNLSEYFNVKVPEFDIDGKLYFTSDFKFTNNIFGFPVIAIETPGHTCGSVCYRIGNYLFTGDTLFKGRCGQTDLPTGSKLKMVNSLKKLHLYQRANRFDDIMVLPGHGDSSTLSYECEHNPVMKYAAKFITE